MAKHRTRAAVTMEDVARTVGVHQATVSRTLSRPDSVNATTRERVLAAVDHLGYVPHAGARQLAGGRTGVLAVLIPDLANPFFARVAKDVQRTLAGSGSQMVVADTDLDPAMERRLVEQHAPNVDGLIVCSPVGPTEALIAASDPTPLVLVNRSTSLVRSVSIDQRSIVRVAVDHLRALGHTSIGLVSGPRGYWSTVQRRRAIRPDDGLIVFDSEEPTFDGGVRAFDAVRRSGVTGVVAFNDLMALGLLRAATDHGLTVPDDLSIVGSDDIPAAAMVAPGLTTVAAPLTTMAERAVALLDTATDATAGGPSRLPVELIVRASTTRPRGTT